MRAGRFGSSARGGASCDSRNRRSRAESAGGVELCLGMLAFSEPAVETSCLGGTACLGGAVRCGSFLGGRGSRGSRDCRGSRCSRGSRGSRCSRRSERGWSSSRGLVWVVWPGRLSLGWRWCIRAEAMSVELKPSSRRISIRRSCRLYSPDWRVARSLSTKAVARASSTSAGEGIRARWMRVFVKRSMLRI